jgi:Anthrone oxygenase
LPGKIPWLRLIQVVLIGVESGRFVDQWFILALSFRHLDATTLSAAVRSIGAANSISMLVTATAVALLFAAILITERDVRSPRGKLTAAALVLFMAVVAITVAHELPLIARIEALGIGPPPPGWQALLSRWLAGHTARTLVSLTLFVAVVVALLLEGRPEPHRRLGGPGPSSA